MALYTNLAPEPDDRKWDLLAKWLITLQARPGALPHNNPAPTDSSNWLLRKILRALLSI
jgi:hypothetical protein